MTWGRDLSAGFRQPRPAQTIILAAVIAIIPACSSSFEPAGPTFVRWLDKGNSNPGEESCDLIAPPEPEPTGRRVYHTQVMGGARVRIASQNGTEVMLFDYVGDVSGIGKGLTQMGREADLGPGTFHAVCIFHDESHASTGSFTLR